MKFQRVAVLKGDKVGNKGDKLGSKGDKLGSKGDGLGEIRGKR